MATCYGELDTAQAALKPCIHMARKKKIKRFRAVTAVKELARERVGAPPSGQIVLEKKKKPEKHKPTLGKLLNDTE
jgi:hypothetical protein